MLFVWFGLPFFAFVLLLYTFVVIIVGVVPGDDDDYYDYYNLLFIIGIKMPMIIITVILVCCFFFYCSCHFFWSILSSISLISFLNLYSCLGIVSVLDSDKASPSKELHLLRNVSWVRCFCGLSYGCLKLALMAGDHVNQVKLWSFLFQKM